MAHILHRAKLTSISSNANAVAKFYTTSDEAYISLTANNCNDYSYNVIRNFHLSTDTSKYIKNC